jgi:hypothetical protein
MVDIRSGRGDVISDATTAREYLIIAYDDCNTTATERNSTTEFKLTDFVEVDCNGERRHSVLGHINPAKFERSQHHDTHSLPVDNSREDPLASDLRTLR